MGVACHIAWPKSSSEPCPHRENMWASCVSRAAALIGGSQRRSAHLDKPWIRGRAFLRWGPMQKCHVQPAAMPMHSSCQSVK